MCLSIMAEEGKISRPLLEFFLRGNLSLDNSTEPDPFQWLPDVNWQDLLQLPKFGQPFESLTADMISNEAAWRTWYQLDALEEAPCPTLEDRELSDFEQLVIMRCF